MVQIYNIMDLQKILTLDLVSFETSTAVNVILAVISVCLLIFFKIKLYRNRDKWSFSLSTPRTTDTSDSPISEDGASMFSRITFSWVHPILTKRSKSANLSIDDMFHMPYNMDVKRVQVAFSKLLRPNDDRSPKTKQTMPSLLQMLVKAYGREVFLYGGFLELFSALISLVGPIYIGFLVSFFENGTEPSHVGYRYVFILFLSTFGKTLVNSKFHSSKWHILSNVRTSVMTSIYRKVLHLNSASLTKFNVGKIVNFLGPDTDRLMGACNSLHTVWSFPLQVTIFTYVLYRLLGIASLSGLVLALVLVPVNKIISTEKIDLRKSLMRKKDEKMKLMNEILGGIKIIKLYAWEEHFRKMIEELREAELQIIKRRKILEGIAGYVWTLAPICMTVLTFSAYCMMGNTLTAAKMLGTLSLLQRLLQTLTQIPSIFDDMIEGAISLGRIEKFMALEDIDYKRYYDTVPETKKDRIVVSVNKGNFTWKDEEWNSSESGKKQTDLISRSVEKATASVTLCLRDINVDVEYGQFIGVIGKVGSGKSSLLNAILAEMFRKEGEISVSILQNGFALADQEPWIQHATVRDNIIFGRPFEAKKYAHILDAASLGKDIEMLPAGDKTEVGENGVTLSGGQKSRLALARALYQDKDVYLLDDPLAAVDAHVAQHMYDKCIMGLLKNKTRILCTHHTNFLGEADLVIVMDDGIIAKMGPPSEVLTDIKFAERRSSERENIDVNKNDKSGNDGKLGDETKIVGDVKLEVYKAYFAALGKWFSVAIVLSIVSMQASMVAKDWWLTHWVSNANIDAVKASVPGYQCFYHNMSTPNSLHGRYDPKPIETFRHSSLLYYMVVYACLSAVYSLFSLAKDILFAYTGMTVARITHNNLLNSMLKAPMSFYDVTPAGRILSRFSSDMAIIDDYISHTVMTVLELLFIVIRTVTVTCYVMPWFLVIIVPITAVYNQLQKRYRHTSREVRRVASLYRSPIFSYFAESISGSVTIRAFRESERFIDELNHRLDTWFKAHYTRENLRLWLWFRTQMFGVTMVTAIAILAVIQHGVCGIDPGIVGLTMSYIITLASILNESVNFATTIERDMVSVERIYQYIEETPSEKWEGFQSVSAWPSAGVISYTDVFMKYRDGLPNVLKGLTFSTRPAEKVGIVGRTGSGKSSLFQTLFRTVEISSGDITIDGMNIQQLDLKDVRRHLAVIPQDPFLFSGTVRENLDPTSSYSDQELWGVLDRCHLRVPVDRLGGLQGEVGEKGRQFSVGQKQLMCLARALLTKAKVLCIDEATASVDLETDKLIQETIRQEFVNSTVLTIAHRINTIMDSDRVLVMDQGQVAELDSPENLLKNPQSQFYQLVYGKYYDN